MSASDRAKQTKPDSVTRLLRRVFSSTGELQNAEMEQAATKEGLRLVSECEDRAKVQLRGYLSSVTVNPRSSSRWLEAEFSDGTGILSLVWMGRRTIVGIDAGRHLRIEGRVSFVDGRRTIYNPKYELL